MTPRWLRAGALLASLALGPGTAFAFDTVDAIPWPSAGGFYPTYVGDPVRPWSVFAYAGAMYDTNVRRRPTDEESDFISRLGIGGRYTARVIGRQSVAFDGYGEHRNYDKFGQYDHFAYGLRALWLWEVGNQLSGVAGWRRSHRLADIGETASAIADLITTDNFDVTGAYRFHPEWRLTGGAGTIRVAHDGRDIDTTHSWSARGGIEYVSGLGNAIGLEYRHSEGDAPVDELVGLGAFENNDYDEDEVALTLAYALAATVRVRGRLGRTERTYSQLSGADFSGTTGRGTLEWAIGAKTLFTADAYRLPDPIIDATALYVDRRGVSAGIAWAATYKVVTTVRAFRERRIYEGDPLVLVGPQRDETVHVLRLGVGWEPERHWQFSTALDFGTRESNFVGRDYDYTALTANLRWSF